MFHAGQRQACQLAVAVHLETNVASPLSTTLKFLTVGIIHYSLIFKLLFRLNIAGKRKKPNENGGFRYGVVLRRGWEFHVVPSDELVVLTVFLRIVKLWRIF